MACAEETNSCYFDVFCSDMLKCFSKLEQQGTDCDRVDCASMCAKGYEGDTSVFNEYYFCKQQCQSGQQPLPVTEGPSSTTTTAEQKTTTAEQKTTTAEQKTTTQAGLSTECTADNVPRVVGIAKRSCDAAATSVTIETSMANYGANGVAVCHYWAGDDKAALSCNWHGCVAKGTILNPTHVECALPPNRPSLFYITVQVYPAGGVSNRNVCYSYQGRPSSVWQAGDSVAYSNVCQPARGAVAVNTACGSYTQDECKRNANAGCIWDDKLQKCTADVSQTPVGCTSLSPEACAKAQGCILESNSFEKPYCRDRRPCEQDTNPLPTAVVNEALGDRLELIVTVQISDVTQAAPLKDTTRADPDVAPELSNFDEFSNPTRPRRAADSISPAAGFDNLAQFSSINTATRYEYEFQPEVVQLSSNVESNSLPGVSEYITADLEVFVSASADLLDGSATAVVGTRESVQVPAVQDERATVKFFRKAYIPERAFGSVPEGCSSVDMFMGVILTSTAPDGLPIRKVFTKPIRFRLMSRACIYNARPLCYDSDAHLRDQHLQAGYVTGTSKDGGLARRIIVDGRPDECIDRLTLLEQVCDPASGFASSVTVACPKGMFCQDARCQPCFDSDGFDVHVTGYVLYQSDGVTRKITDECTPEGLLLEAGCPRAGGGITRSVPALSDVISDAFPGEFSVQRTRCPPGEACQAGRCVATRQDFSDRVKDLPSRRRRSGVTFAEAFPEGICGCGTKFPAAANGSYFQPG